MTPSTTQAFEPVAIAGSGRMSASLGKALQTAGLPVAAVASRSWAHALRVATFIDPGCAAVKLNELNQYSRHILIAVKDDAIAETARTLADAATVPGVALHTSGALGTDVLQPLAAKGFAVGCMHPLQTLPTPEEAPAHLRGTTFGLTGDDRVYQWAEYVVLRLGGRPLRLAASQRANYHAAAVVASNHVTGLVDAAAQILEQAGIQRLDALAALTPLMHASLQNALTAGPEVALTGPVERGDPGTITAHIEALTDGPPRLLELYRSASSHLVDLAVRKGLDAPTAERLLQALAPPKAARRRPVRVPELAQMKERGQRIAMLTAYDYTFARLLDQAGADVLLVGDSLGMVIQGHDTTLPVTMDDMVYHTKAVSRGAKRALVVADLPFLSYQVGEAEALRNAGRLIQEGGAGAVKLEGAGANLSVVRRLTQTGIPVMGHIGLTPQSFHQMGGFVTQAKMKSDADDLIRDARDLEDVGAFAICIEGIPADTAAEITRSVNVPTIGIGAGPHCDGQVLVCYDALGLFDKIQPKFARRYLDLADTVREAACQYVEDVQQGRFPGLDETPADAL